MGAGGSGSVAVVMGQGLGSWICRQDTWASGETWHLRQGGLLSPEYVYHLCPARKLRTADPLPKP